MTDVAYRLATPDDAALVAGIGRRSFTETFAHLYSADNLEAFLAETHDVDGWHRQLSDPDYVVRLAVAPDGTVAGYCKLGPQSLPGERTRPSIELRQLYILAPWQGAGVAHDFMRWAIDEARARGAQDMFLSVYVDNHRARRFYDRYGFVEAGRFFFMVGDHADDERLMRLDLTA